MLLELRVENLLLIERAELALGPGLNVLTGETGAGKTVLAHALDLLLGGRPRGGIVRPGAAEAYVEGAFALTGAVRELAGERLAGDAEELVLARRVWPDGRTRAYLNGRATTLADLRELAEALLAFYGQHEHRRLMLASAQLEVLDAFCGPRQAERRVLHAAAHAEASALERRRGELEAAAGARDREMDLLSFELREIEAAGASEAEEADLVRERDRLRHLESLRTGALGAAEALTPESGAPGALHHVAQAVDGLEAAGGVDPELDGLAVRLRALLLEGEDVAGDLWRYLDGAEGQPGRLEEVEERLALFTRLSRKHGGTLGGVLAHVERCRARQEELAGAEEDLEAATERLAVARAAQQELAGALREARAGEAPKLAGAVRERLGELAMAGASFEVRLTAREAPAPAGGDDVELLIAPNAGVPAGRLRDVASGGELSRVMLALLGVAHGREGGAEDTRLLVFDEVDAGIGGQTARAVGAHLRALATVRQVLCITHLPQIASLADRHFRIAKDPACEPALTTVRGIAGDDVVGELVRMLGAEEGDRAARDHARELLRAA